jgi:hypothetical protein
VKRCAARAYLLGGKAVPAEVTHLAGHAQAGQFCNDLFDEYQYRPASTEAVAESDVDG